MTNKPDVASGRDIKKTDTLIHLQSKGGDKYKIVNTACAFNISAIQQKAKQQAIKNSANIAQFDHRDWFLLG